MKIESRSTSNLSLKLKYYLQNLAISLGASDASISLSIDAEAEELTDTKIRLIFPDSSSLAASSNKPKLERQTSFSIPFSNNEKIYAKITICLPSHVFNTPQKRDALKTLTSDIERLVNQQRVLENSKSFLGDNLNYSGNSKALIALEQDLYVCAKSSNNLVLLGAKGSGKVIAALTVHTLYSGQKGPFVRSNLSDWKSGHLSTFIQRYTLQAFGGTLYIRCGEIISEALVQSIVEIVRDTTDCRVILGITSVPDNISLWTNAYPDWSQDFAIVEVPDLNQRKRDISALVDDFIREQQLSTQLNFRDDCVRLLENYVWTTGVKQLHKLLLNAVIENTETQITPDALIYCCPELRNINYENPKILRNVKDFVRVSEHVDSLDHRHHPAVLRALKFICKNYKTQLDLKTIAKHACVSPSHLSYLIKGQFGLSPMQLVNRYKVERAKHALRNSPSKQITEISSELGFWDLSHFEKVFKRWTGVTPKKFRLQMKQDIAISQHTQKTQDFSNFVHK